MSIRTTARSCALAVAVLLVIAGTAFPQTILRRGAPELGAGMALTDLAGPRLGLSIGDVSADQRDRLKLSEAGGALVQDIEADSPAAHAGFARDDVIVEFDGERVRSARQLRRLVSESVPDRAVKVVVVRGGARQSLTVTPARTGSLLEDRVSSVMRDFNLGDWTRMLGRERARLGVGVQELTPQLSGYFGVEDGVLVTEVEEGSAAQKAGVHAGDVIVSVDGHRVRGPAELRDQLAGKAGHEVTLSVMRDKKPLTLKVQLGSGERSATRRPVIV